jgi:hypothetical protein
MWDFARHKPAQRKGLRAYLTNYRTQNEMFMLTAFNHR